MTETWSQTVERYLREGRTVSGGKGASEQEKQAQAQSAQESAYLQQMMTTQFNEQQGLLNNFLLPQLKAMASNPQGFGAKAISAMQSQLINTVGTQLSSQEKSLNNQFATSNLAGLPSGVNVALQSGLQQGAVGAEASGLQNIAIQNAQLKNQQQQFALGGLQGTTSLLGAAPQSAGLGLQANQNTFGQAYQIQQQGNFMQNLLGGVLGAGLNMATKGIEGGLNSVMNQGESFGSGFSAGAFGG